MKKTRLKYKLQYYRRNEFVRILACCSLTGRSYRRPTRSLHRIIYPLSKYWKTFGVQVINLKKRVEREDSCDCEHRRPLWLWAEIDLDANNVLKNVECKQVKRQQKSGTLRKIRIRQNIKYIFSYRQIWTTVKSQ